MEIKLSVPQLHDHHNECQEIRSVQSAPAAFPNSLSTQRLVESGLQDHFSLQSSTFAGKVNEHEALVRVKFSFFHHPLPFSAGFLLLLVCLLVSTGPRQYFPMCALQIVNHDPAALSNIIKIYCCWSIWIIRHMWMNSLFIRISIFSRFVHFKDCVGTTDVKNC